MASDRTGGLSAITMREAVYAQVMDVATGRKHRLLESLGQDICDSLIEHNPVSRVTVRLRKPNLPFPNNLSHVEICITREATI